MISIRNPILRWALRILMFLSLAFLLFMGGCYGLGKFIYNARACEQFYIDNTEMHVGIDIPSTLDIDCAYNSDKKLKRVYYVIDKTNVGMARYISFSEFKPLLSFLNFETEDFFRFNEDTLQQLKESSTLFYKEHTKGNGEYYKALLDTTSGRVWINLRYAD